MNEKTRPRSWALTIEKYGTGLALWIGRIACLVFGVPSPPIVSVSAIIENEVNNILVLQLSYMDGDALPGGILKGGESAETALLREVKEETNLEVVLHTYLFSVPSSIAGLQTLSLVFLVKAKGEANGSSEGTLMWISPSDAQRNMAYQSNKEAISRYRYLMHESQRRNVASESPEDSS